MSDDTQMVQWSVSLPPAAQYAKGDMLNIKGATVEEVEAQLDAILHPESDFIQKAVDAAAGIRAAALLVNPTPEPAAAPQQAAASGPVQTSRMCAHGPRTRYDGSKNGRSYTAWFCSQPKGSSDQCKAEFD